MIELVFVIVIMGIIGKFGVEFLAQTYRTFIHAKINNELHSNSANALQFIAKRLEYRIAPSTIKRVGTGGFVGVTEVVANPDTYNVLEWIAYDSDGFRGTTAPLWSGIIDLDPSLTTITTLSSVETNTTAIDELIITLSDDNTSGIQNAAIMFNAASHNPNSFGWAGGDDLTDQTKSMHPIDATGNINDFVSGIATDNFEGVNAYNRYMLAWSAYAIVHDGTNLTLYYNYQPWQGENYQTHGTAQLLMENVDTFRIKTNPSGGIFSIMVCARSNLMAGEEHSICKEKVIF